MNPKNRKSLASSLNNQTSISRVSAIIVMLLLSALEEFLLDCESRGLSPMTLRYYRQQLIAFLNYLRKNQVTTPVEITAHDIRAYLLSLGQRGLSDASIHSAARAIRSFCNYLVREELLEKSPMDKVRMPKQEKKILPAFSIEDIGRLLLACTNIRDRVIVLFLLDTGCRASEFVALNFSDVDVRSGRVLVRKGKGRKQRVVFLGKQSKKVLRKYLRGWEDVESDEPLWPNMNSGERLTDSGLRQLLQRLGRRAAVDNCSPHTFRRTFAVSCLRDGMDVFRLQQLLGHADLAMVRRYLALVEDDIEAAHRSHGPVDRLFESAKGVTL